MKTETREQNKRRIIKTLKIVLDSYRKRGLVQETYIEDERDVHAFITLPPNKKERQVTYHLQFYPGMSSECSIKTRFYPGMSSECSIKTRITLKDTQKIDEARKKGKSIGNEHEAVISMIEELLDLPFNPKIFMEEIARYIPALPADPDMEDPQAKETLDYYLR